MADERADQRPDPDTLLARVHEDARSAARGQLRIFFGACAGVGKTYAMLQAAHQTIAQGSDVVVGYVELHGRADTEALLTGLENLKSVGNVSLTVAIISFIYMMLYYHVKGSGYFTLACAGYTVLTLEVWLNAYGKLSAKLLAWSLIIWVPVGLYIPAFLLLSGKPLPF